MTPSQEDMAVAFNALIEHGKAIDRLARRIQEAREKDESSFRSALRSAIYQDQAARISEAFRLLKLWGGVQK
jgi:hypothetical protein